MARTTRQNILRKLDRIPQNMETGQQHVIDCLNTYIELDGNKITIEDILTGELTADNFRYKQQVDGLMTILELLESAKNLSEEIIAHISRL